MKTLKHKNIKKHGGYIAVLVLVFSSIFATILLGLTGFILVQNKASIGKEYKERAVQIAEAGLDYYRWFLAHNPGDLMDGTGEPGPYEHEYEDPETGVIGTFSLEVDGNQECNTVTSIDIVSTGWSSGEPSIRRVVSGKYAQPSVAEYAYIINSNVWAGSDRDIKGRYHSNGGIRMDGTNQSLVTSAVEDWLCTSSFGCSPNQTQDGVFGGGPNTELWSFPSEPVDFVGITQDLVNMKTQAQESGLYFGPVGGESNRRGYHAIFQNDGTLDMYRVTNTSYNWGYDSSAGWQRDYNRITNETFLGNYTVPSDCSLIFVEDKLWIEGVVNGKITIASADVSQPNYDTDIILNGDISYTTQDGSDGLTAIAEDDVLITLYSPDTMSLSGIFIAQNGHFGRNYYSEEYPSYGYSNATRYSLSITGSIVSNGRVGTSWSCGGSFCSGYENRDNSYDRKLATDPPPLTPFVDDEYQFIEWLEVE